MSQKPLSSTELSTSEKDPMEPRHLTEEEIKDVLAVVPKFKSASEQISDYNRLSMLQLLREQLKEITITPLGIDDIKSEITRQYYKSLIKAGTVVGVTAAEALGQPITQMALNAFHQSGSSKNVTYGIGRVREIINASKEPKQTACSIFFKNQNLSFEDIIMKVRPHITEIKVKDLVKSIPDIESASQIAEPWWYQPYRALIRDDFKSNSLLVLEIDTEMLYAYKIDMKDIAKVIEQDQSVICVYSPMNVGLIHIYPIERIVATKIKMRGVVDKNNASMIFLWEAVIPALDKLKISGVTGIQQIYPVETPVWQIVKEEQKTSVVERGWFLILNEVRMKITGITAQKLIKLCEMAGLTVFKVRPNYIGVQTPTGESPTQIVNDLIRADKKAEKEYEDNKRKEGSKIIRRQATPIMVASKLVYADTEGSIYKSNVSTLRTLLGHPNIDNTRTYSNNVHEINAVLGIEAARSFLIRELSDVISYEGYINPRHIVLLVDFMVSLGQVSGITFTGISRQPIGALEKASVEKAMDTFKEAAGFGETKPVIGTSASIYVGKKAQIGTGYSDSYMDRNKFKNLEEEIENDVDMKLDIGDFKDAIDEMDDIISGADIMIMEGAEEEMFAGDEPLFPGGTIETSINQTPDQAVFKHVKGKMVRASELRQAALKLNQAPCLPGPGPTRVRIEDIKTPLKIEELPVMGGLAKLSTDRIKLSTEKEEKEEKEEKTYVSGAMGLPEELMVQMEEFKFSEPPTTTELPKTGLPSPGEFDLPPTAPPGTSIQPPTTSEEKSATVMFDLDTFLS